MKSPLSSLSGVCLMYSAAWLTEEQGIFCFAGHLRGSSHKLHTYTHKHKWQVFHPGSPSCKVRTRLVALSLGAITAWLFAGEPGSEAQHTKSQEVAAVSQESIKRKSCFMLWRIRGDRPLSAHCCGQCSLYSLGLCFCWCFLSNPWMRNSQLASSCSVFDGVTVSSWAGW